MHRQSHRFPGQTFGINSQSAPSNPIPVHRSQGQEQQPNNQGDSHEKPWAETMRLKVYGRKAALEFYETTTRVKNGGKGWRTIQLEAAYKIPGRDEFNWNNKTIIQITRVELPVFIAVMLGIREKCSYHSHGENKDKGFDIIRQQDKGSVFLRVHESKGNTKAVPIDIVEAIMIGHMALAQYLSNYDGRISADVVMNSLHALPST